MTDFVPNVLIAKNLHEWVMTDNLTKEELQLVEQFRKGQALREVYKAISQDMIDNMVKVEKYTNKAGEEVVSNKIDLEQLVKKLNETKPEYEFASSWKGNLFIKK